MKARLALTWYYSLCTNSDMRNAYFGELLQYVAVILMLKSLNDKGYNPLAISMPSLKDLIIMVNLAGPVLLTMLSKVTSCTVHASFWAASGPLFYFVEIPGPCSRLSRL